MIDNKYSFINGLDEEKFISFDNDGDLKFYRCPKCGSYHVVKNGTYIRKTPVNKAKSKITRIQKYICTKCKTSFKYLPLYLASYSHLSVLTLFKVLIDSSSINSLSKVYEISRSSIRSIKERFKTYLNQIDFILRLKPINSFKELLKSYFETFHHFLFSSSTTSDNYLYQVNKLS